MGSGGPGGGLGASGLDHNNRFRQCHFPGGGKKRTGVPDRLHVNQNTLGVGVVPQIIDQVPPIDIQHGTDGNKSAETDMFLKTPVEDGGAKRPALADKTDIPRSRNFAGEGGVKPGQRVHHPEAVGTDDPHLSPPGFFENLLFEPGPFFAALFKTGRNDNGGFDPGPDTFLNNSRDGRGGDHNHRQVDLGRDLTDGRIGFDPHHAGTFWIHGKNGPAERMADEVPDDRAADTPFGLSRPDHGDVGRFEKNVKGLRPGTPNGHRGIGHGVHFTSLTGRPARNARIFSRVVSRIL